MNIKFRGKYRVSSARAGWWDYGWNGAYYITICTKNRKYFFGGIENGRMQLNAIGYIANSCWYEIPLHFQFVELREFVIMPNHIHGIIIIDKPDAYNDGIGLPLYSPESVPSLKTENEFGSQSQNLASIIRGYKIGVSLKARLIRSDFAWQSRYHDRIIRDDEEYQRIARYIADNPKNWENDKFFLS
jgi:putative transposase